MPTDETTIEIETDIPAPVKGGGKFTYGAARALFKQMQPGNSFVIPVAMIDANTKPYVYQAARAEKTSATIRKENGGIRVWRVK